jgi:hypothetical protein
MSASSLAARICRHPAFVHLGEARMDVHQNTPHSREKIVRRVLGGESARSVAAAVGVSESTVRN